MRRAAGLLAYLLVAACSQAQLYPFVHYGPRQGLADNRVRKIFQDSYGRMYFLTYEGLSVYDGARFVNYTTENGLANNLVADIIECGEDSLLLGVNNSRLQVLVKGRIKYLWEDSTISCPAVNYFCRQNDSSIFLGTDNGLYSLSGKTLQQIPLNISGNRGGVKSISKIVMHKSHLLLLGEAPYYNPKANLFLFHLPSQLVVDSCRYPNILDITTGEENSFWISRGGKIEAIPFSIIEENRLRTQQVNLPFNTQEDAAESMFNDRQGNCWVITTNRSVVQYGPADEIRRYTMENGLSSTATSYVFQDRELNIWFASIENGIDKLVRQDLELINLDSDNPVSTIELMPGGRQLLLAKWKDKSYYRKEGPLIHKLAIPPEWKIKILAIDPLDQHLAGWDDKGFTRFTIDANNLVKLKQHIPYPMISYASKGSFDTSHSLAVSSDNNILVIEPDGKVITLPLRYFSDQAMFDKKGWLWGIDRHDNLYAFERVSHKKDSFALRKIFEKPVVGGFRCINIDSRNRIWIGTRSAGLWLIEMDGNLNIIRKLQISTRNGLTNNFVTDICFDNSGSAWISSPSGLDKIAWNQDKPGVENITARSGMYYYCTKSVVGIDGSVTCLTATGKLVHISAANEHRTDFDPRMIITGFHINNQLTESFHSGIKLKHTQNNLSFDVAAPSFIDEQAIRYSYCLKSGSNYYCSEYTNNSTVTLAGLYPGDYSLWLRVIFPGNHYAEKQLRLGFTILPPWWQMGWFRLIAGLLIIGILIIVTRFYFKRKLEKQKILLEKKQAIEKERTRIATDMHDDLGAGLSRIKFLSETIGIKKKQQQSIEEDVVKIKEYSHEMIDKMGEIVWALNEKNDTISDLLAYTRAYSAEYLSQNGIACTIEAPEIFPSDFVTGEYRRNIFLTVKEALHNVVKHSRASAVSVKIGVNKALSIEIHDNGIGYDRKNIRTFSNGISNMKKRIEEINGEFEISNERGTLIKINAPLNP